VNDCRNGSRINGRRRTDPLNAHQRQEALARIDAGETLADIAKTYGVDATQRRLGG
jgi:hypothetical protein